MCDPYDYEPSERLHDLFRKARKPHCCFACREEIRPGDRYHYFSEKFEGQINTYKHCLRCWAILEEIWGRGEAAEYGLDCGVSWQEAFDEPPPEYIAALAFMT